MYIYIHTYAYRERERDDEGRLLRDEEAHRARDLREFTKGGLAIDVLICWLYIMIA